MGNENAPQAPGEGQARPFTCPECGKTFVALKGMMGHRSGVHGRKTGINATLQDIRDELRALQEALVGLEQATTKRHVIEERYASLAQEVAHKPRCMPSPDQERELRLLERVLKP